MEKKKKNTDDEKPTLDLPLPIFAEEKEAGEAAPEGKTGKTKDDGYQSDDSWDKKPGILEDPEEIESERERRSLNARDVRRRPGRRRRGPRSSRRAEAERARGKKEEEELLAKIDPEDSKSPSSRGIPRAGETGPCPIPTTAGAGPRVTRRLCKTSSLSLVVEG